MRIQSLRLITTWISGAIVGTLLIALASPLFVRSYLPQQVDAVRGVAIPDSGSSYRWRSEGYATTHIGPLGMPGRTTVPASEDHSSLRVALWGDSQGEGVCVADEQKIHAQAQRLAAAGDTPLTVFPLARSGDDAGDWLAQIPAVEEKLAIDVHVMLIVELADLIAATEARTGVKEANHAALAHSQIAARVPAFVIQAGRNLLTEADTSSPRQLRFHVGPVEHPVAIPQITAVPIDWSKVVQAIKATTDRTVVLLYAPQSPHIMDGQVVTEDASAAEFEELSRVATSAGLRVVDVRDALRDSAQLGAWPFGFHNGNFGSGHLNVIGNNRVASALVAVVAEHSSPQN